MSASKGNLLIHAVGGGDLGFAGELDFAGRTPDFDGGPEDTGRQRRPIRKLFDVLASADIRIDDVALLGTRSPQRPGDRTFLVHAGEMRERLTSQGGLCGVRFPAGRVHVVAVTEPTVNQAMTAVTELLPQIHPAQCLVTTGSGSFALCAGTLFAAIEAGTPVSLVHLDATGGPYRLDSRVDSETGLRNLAVRHRFWEELADLDPDHRLIWQLLAARQRIDTTMARRAAGNDERSPVKPGLLRKLEELWPTVQAATFERLGRGEVADHGLLRAWCVEQLVRFFIDERGGFPPEIPALVEDLLGKLSKGTGVPGALASEFRSARNALPPGLAGRCAQMVRDAKLGELYDNAATHTAHLASLDDDLRPLPPTVIDAADRWERGDLAPGLVAATSMTTWPVLGSGDVLALMAVGLDRDGRDDEDRHALEAVIRELHGRRERCLRRGRLLLKLLATSATEERASRLVAAIQPLLHHANADAVVIAGLPTGPDEIDAVRSGVLASLGSGAEPTGRFGSGSIRDVDEVVLVLNPGTAVVNLGMIGAGVDWSQTAACPLWVVEVSRHGTAGPVLRAGCRVLYRLGADRTLARLAAVALHHLDVRTAVRLLSHGSSMLETARQVTERLAHEVFADPGSGIGDAARNASARRRLSLIANVLRDHPWLVCYVAVEVLRPALYSWSRWAKLVDAKPSLRALSQARNGSPYGHLLDRLRAARRNGQPARLDSPPDATALIANAVADLEGPGPRDDDLVTAYERVLARLHDLSAGPGVG